MALSEQPSRGDGQNKWERFDAIADQFAADDVLEKFNDRLIGFPVENDPEVRAFHEEGLGRLFRVELNVGNRRTLGVDGKKNRGFMYGMPKKVDESTGRVSEALLMFPGRKGTDYCIVRPKRSDAAEEFIREEDNALYDNLFDGLLSPSQDSYMHPNWTSQPGKNDYESFITRPDLFSAFIEVDPNPVTDKDKVEATATARKLKIERFKSGDDFGVREEDVFAQLDLLEQEWSEAAIDEGLVELFNRDDPGRNEAA